MDNALAIINRYQESASGVNLAALISGGSIDLSAPPASGGASGASSPVPDPSPALAKNLAKERGNRAKLFAQAATAMSAQREIDALAIYVQHEIDMQAAALAASNRLQDVMQSADRSHDLRHHELLSQLSNSFAAVASSLSEAQPANSVSTQLLSSVPLDSSNRVCELEREIEHLKSSLASEKLLNKLRSSVGCTAITNSTTSSIDELSVPQLQHMFVFKAAFDDSADELRSQAERSNRSARAAQEKAESDREAFRVIALDCMSLYAAARREFSAAGSVAREMQQQKQSSSEASFIKSSIEQLHAKCDEVITAAHRFCDSELRNWQQQRTNLLQAHSQHVQQLQSHLAYEVSLRQTRERALLQVASDSVSAVAAIARTHEADVKFLVDKLSAAEQLLLSSKVESGPFDPNFSAPVPNPRSLRSSLLHKAAEAEAAASSREMSFANNIDASASSESTVCLQVAPLLERSCQLFDSLHVNLCQRLADLDRESGEVRALNSAPISAIAAAPASVNSENSTVSELQQQLQLLQERLTAAEWARIKDMQLATAEHSDQLHRLHHKLASTELQVQLLQRYDSELERNLKALAAETPSKILQNEINSSIQDAPKLLADLASSRAECASLRALVEQLRTVHLRENEDQSSTAVLHSSNYSMTPAKILRHPSNSNPNSIYGVSPANLRAVENNTNPILPLLRRPSDFGSPGVAVAASTASLRPSSMPSCSQDDAMDMLLQKLASTSMDADARVDVVRQQLQALQQSFATFAVQFNTWRQRAFTNCKAVFDRASAEAATVDFDDAHGLLRWWSELLRDMPTVADASQLKEVS